VSNPSVSRAPKPRPRRRQVGSPRSLAAILRSLRRGELVFDGTFDHIFPLSVRRASNIHWTPVEIAVRAARLLAEGLDAPVLLDVGAGVGKFCTIAAATVEEASVRGVEHREHFVEIARAAAHALDVDVEFVHGAIADHDFSGVTGIYLFNPFAENLSPRGDHLDETVELNEDAFWRDVRAVERFLERAPAGTRVVTYCGWGGTMPASYELVLRERRAGVLELWTKTEAPGP
jgi:SAM-dependent methyltransferase